MKKIVYFMTIWTVLIVTMVGCQNDRGEDLQIEFMNEGNTYRTGEFITFNLGLSDQEGAPVTADQVYFYMNMERMNHPMEGTMIEVSPGNYEIELPLAMEGEWLVEITTTKENKVIEERFYVHGEGDMAMEYMTGYNADENS
ncbi:MULTISPECIES: FixH family protein [Bacillaceae]|uniref:FixH family protein n=1 Tax=Evansella alkalicola TaxID=745819 RepID=A0ABS6JXA6_9BACI|nr:FixH family protein [Litchfieldia alkalitelluris]MBU9721857.1 FixH family protein [Bacillus alkalicola]